jgi:hypothetical protein
VIGSDGKDGGLERFEGFSVFLLVEVNSCAVLFVYELVVAGLALSCLYCLSDPPFEFKMRSVGTTVDSEISVVFALPKFFRGRSKDFPFISGEVGLVGVVEVRVIWLPKGGIAIFVKKELAKVVILEGKLQAGRSVVVLRQ